ncbi:MAG: transcriptional repressor [Clostridia bacterium]
MRAQTYKTKQKQMILDFLKTNSHTSMTAKDIEDSFARQNVLIGKSTIYRYLDRLVESGEIRRFVNDQSKSASFQFTGKEHNCHDHIHLKCINCGSFLHLECNHMSKVNEHILAHHNFAVDNSKTIILGICNECNNKIKG